VVMVGKRLQHREAGGLFLIERVALERNDLRRSVLLVDEGTFEREIDEAGDEIAREGRNLAQQQLQARGRLQQLENVVNGGVGLAEFVEEEEVRNFLVFKLTQDELQLRHFLLVHLADDDRSIDGRQRRAHVMRKLDRAGAVDEGEALAHEGRGGNREL